MAACGGCGRGLSNFRYSKYDIDGIPVCAACHVTWVNAGRPDEIPQLKDTNQHIVQLPKKGSAPTRVRPLPPSIGKTFKPYVWRDSSRGWTEEDRKDGQETK